MNKPREFWIQWLIKDIEDDGHIKYPAVCSKNFLSVTGGEMIHVREVVTPDPRDEALKEAKDLLKHALNDYDCLRAMVWLAKYRELVGE